MSNGSPEEFVDPLSDYEPAEYPDNLHRALAEETVQTIQSRPYAEVAPTIPIRQAVHALHGLKVSSLLVVDQGRLVGIFTERDALEKVAEQYPKLADSPVSEVMTSDPIVVYDCDPLGAALAAIAIGGYRHVPVLSVNDKVLGIVSPRRVLDCLSQRFDGGSE
jgi:CBS domain-containing protein